MIIEAVRSLQEAINRIGLGGTMLALPAPKTFVLPDYSETENDTHEKFLLVITYDALVSVCRDLFVSGFYQQAVEHAFKVLDGKVQATTSLEASGTSLMQKVFSPNNPIILLNPNKTRSERDQQDGYMRLFSGSMLGIRNPCTHEIDWFSEPEEAFEVIHLCQHLCRKIDEAYFIDSSKV